MDLKQKTIQQEFSLRGTGLHMGCRVTAKFKPACENSGVQFIRIDLPQKTVLKADVEHVCSEGIPRCTSLRNQEVVIHTVEHLMSALCALGITNLLIEIDGPELPGLDGSSLDFINAFQKAGIIQQDVSVEIFKVREPVGVSESNAAIYVIPDEEFKISYALDYNYPALSSQFFSLTVNEVTYARELAPARTFCLEEEAQELRNKGLGMGANYQNTLVFGHQGVIDNKLRFPNECVRHKVLDFIGDLYLLGVPIRGHVFATKSGHRLNVQLLKKIEAQRKKWLSQSPVFAFKREGREIDINGIMKILPHRYPFLLVDRVFEIEKGKKGIGIKNVTINDGFFQGHFPMRPVMPGVLMVEAMAQTAGVVFLASGNHHGKVALFLSADNVKFRKMVVPGDQLMMEIEVLKDKMKAAQVRGMAKVNGEIVAEADMVFSFTDASYLYE